MQQLVPPEIDLPELFKGVVNGNLRRMCLQNRRSRLRSMLGSKWLGFKSKKDQKGINLDHWKYVLMYEKRMGPPPISSILYRGINDERFKPEMVFENNLTSALQCLNMGTTTAYFAEGFNHRYFNFGPAEFLIQSTDAYRSVWSEGKRLLNVYSFAPYDDPLVNGNSNKFETFYEEGLLTIFRIVLTVLLVETEYMLENYVALCEKRKALTKAEWNREVIHRMVHLKSNA